jgi:aminoglycoside/choline kinase family phosphotransferase
MLQLPDLPNGFSPEFLTRALSEASSLPNGSRVTSAQWQPIGDGTGMLAELVKIDVSYQGDRDGFPDSFVAKFASRNETNRSIAQQYNVYEREVRFFQEMASRISIATPRIYFSSLSGDRFLLLMEDLTAAKVGSQTNGATLAQTEAAIDELVSLHATFWERTDDVPWIPGIANSFHAVHMHDLAHAGWDNMVEMFGVPDHVRRHKARFLSSIPTLQAACMAEPMTLTHGDFRAANLLYRTHPNQPAVTVIDWQGLLKAHGMIDFALFVGQSTKTEVRRRNEQTLLRRYVDGLKHAGIADVDYESIWDRYRLGILYNWVYTAVVAGSLDVGNETSFEWISNMVARQVAASEDLGIFDYLPS